MSSRRINVYPLERLKALSTRARIALAAVAVVAFLAVAACACLGGMLGLGLIWPEIGTAPADTASPPVAEATHGPAPRLPTCPPLPNSPTPLWTAEAPSTEATPLPPAATPLPSPQAEAAGTQAQVVGVTDGDTIQVSIEGAVFPLHYLGIDAPEMSEPLGDRARQANRQLVEGQAVTLEKDVSEMDNEGRLLRYVYLADGTFVNRKLVRQGWAAAQEVPPDTRYAATLAQAEQAAREKRQGIWAEAP